MEVKEVHSNRMSRYGALYSVGGLVKTQCHMTYKVKPKAWAGES